MQILWLFGNEVLSSSCTFLFAWTGKPQVLHGHPFHFALNVLSLASTLNFTGLCQLKSVLPGPQSQCSSVICILLVTDFIDATPFTGTTQTIPHPCFVVNHVGQAPATPSLGLLCESVPHKCKVQLQVNNQFEPASIFSCQFLFGASTNPLPCPIAMPPTCVRHFESMALLVLLQFNLWFAHNLLARCTSVVD
eukprot:TRINITY_DN66188_c0_g1_i4.p1 TRINITY_DN66188_c0_g1~~TRINITY_DN66188_c0_g1_i4.p1  ORF type:complete len:193 (+),score=0.56 TRINITY_DN66188_c0_g1_i4:362-940(+)